MIISDKHRFAFVHIPKCAGSSIRKVLAPYDDYEGWFDGRIDTHPKYGRLDFVHLPLELLKEVLPQEYEKVAAYDAYALVRDPRQRFQSAFAQYVKMYCGIEIAQMDTARMESEIVSLTETLKAVGKVIPPELIHFSRQASFLGDDSGEHVRNVFPIERIDQFLQALSTKIGAPLTSAIRENQTQVMRFSALRGPILQARRLVKAVMPASAFNKMRAAGRSVLLRPVQDEILPVFRTQSVGDFVNEHYAQDFEIYAKARRDHPEG